ncbi:precorrin-2 dehydrogenase/sirohydrochlorin ferrochelatase family protein [Aurantiacibacter suaedae]|uniref:precorrin-2 dehydrogenase/sirohydrochlorin ferrochelatase family protein n=1 Tax=Aurantiacibacter suaedae TaxID=2545755 RepID=UPI0010FA39B3|nr:bifunctional precorrin-2 dehydrogenase/sirohydrochlorin ferrochelatase [Aurantiacibacter suaedae]
MRSLPLFHRIAGQPVIVLGEGEAAAPKARLVERAGGLVVTNLQRGIDEGARLAFVAHEDEARCEADALRLRGAGLLVNVVDKPDWCDFTTPSLLERDPVLIAVGTSGASAGLAKHLRLRLEALLPPSLGRLAQGLSEARGALRKAFPDSAERRRALDAALGEGGALDPLDSGSADRLGEWLAAGGDAAAPTMHEFTVASDDPDDLTLRQARLLGMADVVVADPQVSEEVLVRARADAMRLMLPHEGEMPEGLIVIVRRA